MAAISSAPQPRAASASRLRPRPWVTRLLLTLALICCDVLAINSSFVGVYVWSLINNEDLDETLVSVNDECVDLLLTDQLRSMVFWPFTNITTASVIKIIEFAARHPRREFYFRFKFTP